LLAYSFNALQLQPNGSKFSQVSHGEIEVRKIILVKKWLSEYFTREIKSLSWCTSTFVFLAKKFFVREITRFCIKAKVFDIFMIIVFIFYHGEKYVEITALIFFVSMHRIQYEPHTDSIPFCNIMSMALTWAHRCHLRKPNLCSRGTRNFFLRR